MKREVRTRCEVVVLLAVALACKGDGAKPRQSGATCVATTCATLGAECGTVADGCGGVLPCGDCAAGETCGGGGANRCGTAACTARTCAALEVECGIVGDGCGATLDCGGCPAGQTCGGGGTASRCGGTCTATTCAAAGAACGPLANGCGGTLDCGGCPEGQTCGGGGNANACGAPPPQQGGSTRWALDLGGAGDEHVGALAVRDDGVVVALTELPDASGLVWISPDGKVLTSRTYPGAGCHGLTVSNAGEVFLGCASFPKAHGTVVKLSRDGDLVWSAEMFGVASELAVDAAGGVLVHEGYEPPGHGGAVLKLRPDGEVDWSWMGMGEEPEHRTALAFDPDGNALVAIVLTVRKLDAHGDVTWTTEFPGSEGFLDGVITGIGATSAGTIVVSGLYFGTLTLGDETIALPEGATRGVFLAAFTTDGKPRWLRAAGAAESSLPAPPGADVGLAVTPDGSLALLVGGHGCDFRVERWSIDGARLWSRGVDAPGCTDAAVFPTDVAVGPRDDVFVGGAFSVPVDFGTGTIEGKGGEDGFVLELAP